MSTVWQLRARRSEPGCEEPAKHDNGDHERDEHNDKKCDTNFSERSLKAQRPRRGHIMIVTSICFILSYVFVYVFRQ